jgi:hypothetical protein
MWSVLGGGGQCDSLGFSLIMDIFGRIKEKIEDEKEKHSPHPTVYEDFAAS